MKKAIFSMLAVLVLAVTLLVGCSSEAPDTLEGTTWSIVSVASGDQTLDVKEMAEKMGASDQCIVTFEEDGKGVARVVDQVQNFTYSYEKGKLTTEGKTFDVTGDKIVLEMDGVTMTLERK